MTYWSEIIGVDLSIEEACQISYVQHIIYTQTAILIEGAAQIYSTDAIQIAPLKSYLDVIYTVFNQHPFKSYWSILQCYHTAFSSHLSISRYLCVRFLQFHSSFGLPAACRSFIKVDSRVALLLPPSLSMCSYKTQSQATW